MTMCFVTSLLWVECSFIFGSASLVVFLVEKKILNLEVLFKSGRFGSILWCQENICFQKTRKLPFRFCIKKPNCLEEKNPCEQADK